jgi:hypothetical protein
MANKSGDLSRLPCVARDRRVGMVAENLLYQVVPLVLAIFVVLTVFRPRVIGSAVGALVEMVLMALYECSDRLVLDYLRDDLERRVKPTTDRTLR